MFLQRDRRHSPCGVLACPELAIAEVWHKVVARGDVHHDATEADAHGQLHAVPPPELGHVEGAAGRQLGLVLRAPAHGLLLPLLRGLRGRRGALACLRPRPPLRRPSRRPLSRRAQPPPEPSEEAAVRLDPAHLPQVLQVLLQGARLMDQLPVLCGVLAEVAGDHVLATWVQRDELRHVNGLAKEDEPGIIPRGVLLHLLHREARLTAQAATHGYC
mmetsp:Transcript_65319/g.210542  ORF Transcript_65319/g.210542 Transcript_65319/m.210542 type:complete len:216 (-) Transcript_65319:134-781(-)